MRKNSVLLLSSLSLCLMGCGQNKGYVECQSIVVYRSYAETKRYDVYSYAKRRVELHEYKDSVSGKKIYLVSRSEDGIFINGWKGNETSVVNYEYAGFIGYVSLQDRMYYSKENKSIILDSEFGEYKGQEVKNSLYGNPNNKKAARCLGTSFYYADDFMCLQYGEPSSGAIKRKHIQLGENTKVMFEPRVK